MKKLFVLFICLFTLSTATYAREDRPIRVDQLPAKAQQFIKKYFAHSYVYRRLRGLYRRRY